MTWAPFLPWLGLAGLGALHGVNPGMGWLFAVALGLQEQKGSAVWRALPPLALGHGLAILAVLGLAAAVELVIPVTRLRWVVAGLLLTLGVYRLFRHGHPRYGGMQVGARELTLWSFLMASAHGAGLMVLPVVLGMRRVQGTAAVAGQENGSANGAGEGMAMGHGMAASDHASHLDPMLSAAVPGQFEVVQITLVHTLAYLLVTGLVALIVYEKLGLRLLRKAWINLDLIWAGALILTAIVTPFL